MSPDASGCYLPLSLIAPADGAGDAFIGLFLLFFVTGSRFLSAVLNCSLSFNFGDGLLFAVFGHLLSFITCSSLLPIVLGCFLSLVGNDSFWSTVWDCFLSFVANNGSLFAVFDGGPLSFMLTTGSWVLFLTSISSCTHYFFLSSLPFFYPSLPFLPILFASNPALLTGKGLFDQVFITQRLIASIQ